MIDFALLGDDRCGLSTGANRNCLLLDTLDACVFSADDDSVCRTAPAPERKNAVAYTREYDPTRFWFFPERQAALEALPAADMDVLDQLEQLLGRTLAEAGVGSAAGGRVALALPGLVGDSGMGSSGYLLSLNGPSRARLLESPSAYRSAFRSREVLRTVQQPTVAASAFCMSTFFGFDNRLRLPPFLPVERNADGIFGLVTHRRVEGSHVAFLPCVLLHAPAAPRVFARYEAWTAAEGVNIADLLIASIQSLRTAGVGGEDGTRLRRLGGFLRELGSLPLDDFEAFLRTGQQLLNLARATQLEARLHEHGAAPALWAADVRKVVEALRRSATRRDSIVPRDLRRGRDPESARRLTRTLMARYGEMLEVWPPLLEAARCLRAEGCRVSHPVS